MCLLHHYFTCQALPSYYHRKGTLQLIYFTLMVKEVNICEHQIGLQVRVIYELLHINKEMNILTTNCLN